MDLASDPVAVDVAGNSEHLTKQRSGVELCGYVLLRLRQELELTPLDADEPGVPVLTENGAPVERLVDEVRLYTSKSFDQWIEIPRTSVRSQRANLAEYDGRSQIWVDPDTTVRHCRLTNAADLSQTLSSGIDDPTAYPGKSRGG